MQGLASTPPITLYKATSFWRRLRGLHACPGMTWHAGLYIAPCRAIHTFGLPYAIDVVFLDACHRVVSVIHNVPPRRWAYCLKAVAVIEFPAGYCLACPDFHHRLLAALTPHDEDD